ncbi:GlyS Glycyl-tRNA synthetase, beta subunit [Candidatus Methylopumilus universalis]|uniref:glycine--tRNA ligase subunit beta n=1 Tax=Candidatus Methylopumilus universalis TaxID=2588536 RepID=UPI003BEEDC20
MKLDNLLIELLTEELPPKSQKQLGIAFAKNIKEFLVKHHLVNETSEDLIFSTPRRIGLHLKNVKDEADDENVSIKLMPASVGFDTSEKPTDALLKKLHAIGLNETALNDIVKKNENNAEILYINKNVEGAKLKDIIAECISSSLARLPIKKMMSYQLADGWTTVNFVRPAHGLIILHGANIIDANVLGISSNRTTFGHRFESKKETIEIQHADQYEKQMKAEGAVIVSFDERKALIKNALNEKATHLSNQLTPIDDEDLLDEVTALVEYPNVLAGEFESKFLDVPQECLILSMKANQKYFPLIDKNNKLANQFLIVSNISPKNSDLITQGNEKVIRPRLSDAEFFYTQDKKKPLKEYLSQLAHIVYHNKLGSQADRSERVKTIASLIVKNLNQTKLLDAVILASDLSKADLSSNMVGEFPELQGIMGRYYALNEKISDEIAFAIEDHYKPRFSGDTLPRSTVGDIVAIADKIETLVGLFSIGEKPTGDKDPFALRRQVIGIIRILTEKNIDLNLNTVISESIQATKLVESKDLNSFIYDRLSNFFKDQGYAALDIEAVLAIESGLINEIPKRLNAIKEFLLLPESEDLASANKRVGNILKKADVKSSLKVNQSLLKDEAEINLYNTLDFVDAESRKEYKEKNYSGSLKSLCKLKNPIDQFFKDVMVNAEDESLKMNRLALLEKLYSAMNLVADLSKLSS